jgi:hypothetical protein
MPAVEPQAQPGACDGILKMEICNDTVRMSSGFYGLGQEWIFTAPKRGIVEICCRS